MVGKYLPQSRAHPNPACRCPKSSCHLVPRSPHNLICGGTPPPFPYQTHTRRHTLHANSLSAVAQDLSKFQRHHTISIQPHFACRKLPSFYNFLTWETRNRGAWELSWARQAFPHLSRLNGPPDNLCQDRGTHQRSLEREHRDRVQCRIRKCISSS